MARIQILELPSDVVGDEIRSRYAVILDQVESHSPLLEAVNPEHLMKSWEGRAGLIITSDTIDIPANG